MRMPVHPSAGKIYSLLRRRFGFRNWWPGETRTEIAVGAILTQQTSWRNVEKAIKGLKGEGLLDLDKIASCRTPKLERVIHPSGFYRQKAARLKRFSTFVKTGYGTLDKFLAVEAARLRVELLSINGIGPETADSIILYAAGKPSFVVDAYTRREMSRIYGLEKEPDYGTLKAHFESNVRRSVKLYKDMHAQFVELGKAYCKPRPLCKECPLVKLCRYPSKSVQFN